jgi:hypothetical protein
MRGGNIFRHTLHCPIPDKQQSHHAEILFLQQRAHSLQIEEHSYTTLLSVR